MISSSGDCDSSWAERSSASQSRISERCSEDPLRAISVFGCWPRMWWCQALLLTWSEGGREGGRGWSASHLTSVGHGWGRVSVINWCVHLREILWVCTWVFFFWGFVCEWEREYICVCVCVGRMPDGICVLNVHTRSWCFFWPVSSHSKYLMLFYHFRLSWNIDEEYSLNKHHLPGSRTPHPSPVPYPKRFWHTALTRWAVCGGPVSTSASVWF